MADSKKLRFSKPPILNVGLVGLIDARGIDVAQPI
jgi:hypothetical protein